MSVSTRPRACSNPTPGLLAILALLGSYLIFLGAWAVLDVALSILSGALQ